MAILVTDPDLEHRLLEERRLSGGDRYDEVWDGVYVMSPLANDDHQRLVTRLSYVFEDVIGMPGLGDVRAGVNVSDHDADWSHNYRCPDVAVRLNGGRAMFRENHWMGGPDFAVEILSRGDRSRQKFDFYAAIATRELLLIDRHPWALELYALREGKLVKVGESRVGTPQVIASEVLAMTFRLVAGEPTPKIEVAHTPTGRSWLV